MKKNALFSIGEIAKSLGITRRIILNYESKGLIVPDLKDGVNGNRYYTADSFTRIRTIRVFQNFGLTLDEIRGYYNNEINLDSLIKRLEIMRDELNLSIEKLYERANKSTEIIKKISIDAQTIYYQTYNAPSISERANLLRNTAIEAMKNYGTDTTKRLLFIDYSMDNPNDITFCVSIPLESKGANVKSLTNLKAISTFHHGAYEDIPKVVQKLLKYANDNKIKHSGVFRHLYLEGPPQHKDKSKFITQVMLFIDN